MTAKEAREMLKTDKYAFADWERYNVEAVRAIESTIARLEKIMRILNHDNDVLHDDQTKTNDDDRTALNNEREAAMIANSLKSISATVWNLDDMFYLK